MQNSKTFDSETSNRQPVNRKQTSTDTAGVHQRTADPLQSINVSFFCQNPTPEV